MRSKGRWCLLDFQDCQAGKSRASPSLKAARRTRDNAMKFSRPLLWRRRPRNKTARQGHVERSHSRSLGHKRHRVLPTGRPRQSPRMQCSRRILHEKNVEQVLARLNYRSRLGGPLIRSRPVKKTCGIFPVRGCPDLRDSQGVLFDDSNTASQHGRRGDSDEGSETP